MIKRVKLGEIASLKTGPFGTQFSAKEYVSSGIPVINVKNIGYGQIITDGLEYVSEDTKTRLSEHVLQTGDIVFGRKGSVDRHAYISDEYAGWVQGSDCIRLRFQTGINTRYVSHFLKLDYVKKQINHSAVGSTMASLNTDILRNLEILIPELEVQNEIENALSLLEEKIKLNSRTSTELESLAKTIYDYWFLQFEFPNEEGLPYKSSGGKMVWSEELKREIPEGWNTTTIGDITICHDSKRIPLKSKERSFRKGTYPYYGATTVMDYIDEYIFDGDYVLLAEDGSVMDDKGYPIIQRITGKTWVNNHAHVLEPIRGYNCKALMLLLKDVPVVKIKTGSIQMKITQENLNRYNILDIPIKYLSKITPILEDIDKLQLKLIGENRELAALRDWLLPMLMNGQVGFKDVE